MGISGGGIHERLNVGGKGDLAEKKKGGRNKLVGWGRKQIYEKPLKREGVGQIRGTKKVLTYLEASHKGVGESSFFHEK